MTTLAEFGLNPEEQYDTEDGKIRGVLIGRRSNWKEAEALATAARKRNGYMRPIHIFPADEEGTIKVVEEAP
jgi:hypothetical protein